MLHLLAFIGLCLLARFCIKWGAFYLFWHDIKREADRQIAAGPLESSAELERLIAERRAEEAEWPEANWVH